MASATQGHDVEYGRRTREQPSPADAGFYARYDWCLSPLLTLDDQLTRLGEELDYVAHLAPGWQRDECATNVYLLTCGIACTVDDYLGRRVWDLTLIAERFPRLRFATPILQWGLSLPHALRKLIWDHPVRRWRARWTRCVDLACEVLVGAATLEGEQWSELRSTCDALARGKLPRRLRQRRLRIPEGFRCQDLSHHDVLALARRFAERHPHRASALVVIGVRTAGGYFAPLAKACLATLGQAPVSWLSIRPREGLTGQERRALRHHAKAPGRFLVIDDHPNTGRTLTLVLAALSRCGIAPERITILTPRHPVRPDWTLPHEARGADRVRVVTLEPEETYKTQLLTPAAVEPLLAEWLGGRGWRRVAVRGSPQVEALNARLAEHCRDGFQVRLKRVFEVELRGDNAEPIIRHVVAKSVGWGWLGYHAYLAGTRLADFVPPVIGLRHGLLFAEWIGGLGEDGGGALKKAVPAATLGAYVARRTRCLRLSEDPGLGSEDSGWDGWKMLLGIMRRAYGPYVGRLKIAALRKGLQGLASPHPTLIDGRMRPGEWLEANGRAYKVDYEQHNFGLPELDVVDPAYDLASAILEFGLDEQRESQLVQAYVRQTDDRSVADRIVLYTLLSGTVAMQQAAYWAPCARTDRQGAHWNGRYLAARSFLAYQIHRRCARLLARRPAATWSGPLFSLDLDGVFDCEVLGFPHTTVSGLVALALLQARGFAVVLNTGRSVEHVRRYCGIYGLPGGVGEYGSVFVDALGGREVPLTTPAAIEQLARCRDALRALPGVFVDHEYRYAAHSYRYQGGRTVGLAASEVQEFLSRPQFRGLAAIATSADTYFVQGSVTKGTALLAVKDYLGRPNAPVTAIGDSDEDLAMLEMAECWYAPANCSARVRELARSSGGRILKRPRQRGFLEATEDLLRAWGVVPSPMPGLRRPTRVVSSSDFLLTLLHVAERSRTSQFLEALAWRRL